MFLFDLKHMDSDIHKKYTGQKNEKILENAALLIENNADVLFRNPLIPGVNDTECKYRGNAQFLKSLGNRAMRLELMPFHRMGKDKYKALDMEYALGDLEIMEMKTLRK